MNRVVVLFALCLQALLPGEIAVEAVLGARVMFSRLYAILESEARLAAAALGLDPGLGVLHGADRPQQVQDCIAKKTDFPSGSASMQLRTHGGTLKVYLLG